MIALWSENPYWQELLRQEGVAFVTGSRLAGRDVVVLNERPSELHAHRAWQHTEAGAGLLADGSSAAAVWLESRPKAMRLRWVAPETDSPLFRNVGIVDLEASGSLPKEANVGFTDSGTRAVEANPAGSGYRVLLPFDVTGVLSDTSSGPRQFPAGTPRFPFDTVARVSRGEVRRLVANSLRLLLERKGLPYVYLAPVPGPAASTFAFRVDTDFCPRRELEAVARLADRADMKLSWFVNVGAHRRHLDLFADLARQGHDIQLHCLRHSVYPDYKRNFDNFRRGRDAMADAGLNPVGVVAPFGEWNLNLNRAFEELGLEYSSEFCLAYDDLPFRPVVEGRLGKVLQVPVHPICLGRLVAARANEKQIAAYFRSLIDLQVARREPCFLYDHPERIVEFSNLLADVLAYGRERCGAATTMTAYARWWQKREQCKWSATTSDKVLQVAAKADASTVSVVVEQGGSFAVLPAGSGRYDLAELTWRPLPEAIPFNPDSLESRKPSPLLRAKNLHRRVRKNLQGHRG